MRNSQAVSLAVVVFAANLAAGPITFIQTGTGSGSIGGTSFGSTRFTITSVGDTSNRTAISGGYVIDPTSAAIAIVGVGTFTFSDSMHEFLSSGTVGFSRGSSSGDTDLFDGPTSSLLNTWDMASSIGPINGSGTLFQWASPAVNTSGGVLVFSDHTSDATFQAILGTSTPEPGSWMLVLAGLAAVKMAARQRKG